MLILLGKISTCCFKTDVFLSLIHIAFERKKEGKKKAVDKCLAAACCHGYRKFKILCFAQRIRNLFFCLCL